MAPGPVLSAPGCGAVLRGWLRAGSYRLRRRRFTRRISIVEPNLATSPLRAAGHLCGGLVACPSGGVYIEQLRQVSGSGKVKRTRHRRKRAGITLLPFEAVG